MVRVGPTYAFFMGMKYLKRLVLLSTLHIVLSPPPPVYATTACSKELGEVNQTKRELKSCLVKTQKNTTPLNKASLCQEQKFNEFQAGEKLATCREARHP
jgi:hypothetical protein